MGLLAKSTIGLGTVSVRGLSRVPKPPTKMRAFSPDTDPLVATMPAGCRGGSGVDRWCNRTTSDYSRALHRLNWPQRQTEALVPFVPGYPLAGSRPAKDGNRT